MTSCPPTHTSATAFLLLAAASFPATGADDLAAALGESRITGFAKAMYIVDDKKGGRKDQSTLGVGGKIGLQTGDWQGLGLKAAWYTTNDLGTRHDDPRKTDAYMFDADKQPYSLWGEAQLNYTLGKTTLTAGRQEFFSPIINSYEYRIIPNLFEAYTLKNQDIDDTTLTLAYVNRMSGLDGLLDYSRFRSMSQQTYTSLKVDTDRKLDTSGDTLDPSRVVGHRGVWAGGLVFERTHRLQLWYYHGQDTYNTLYADGRFRQALNDELSATLEAQAYRVNATGQFKTYLSQQGLNGDYALQGLKGTLAHRSTGISLALAFNRYTGNGNTVTAYGNWGGYPDYVVMPYLYAENGGASAIARSHLSRLTLLFDLSKIGLAGQSLLLGRARINLDEKIMANSDITVNALVYRAQITPKLSTRITLDSRHSRHTRYDNDFVTLGLRYDY